MGQGKLRRRRRRWLAGFLPVMFLRISSSSVVLTPGRGGGRGGRRRSPSTGGLVEACRRWASSCRGRALQQCEVEEDDMMICSRSATNQPESQRGDFRRHTICRKGGRPPLAPVAVGHPYRFRVSPVTPLLLARYLRIPTSQRRSGVELSNRLQIFKFEAERWGLDVGARSNELPMTDCGCSIAWRHRVHVFAVRDLRLARPIKPKGSTPPGLFARVRLSVR